MKRITVIPVFIAFFICGGLLAQNKLPPEKFKLKNGLEITFIDYGTLPAITLSAFIDVGKKAETPGQQYLSQLTANALMLGNAGYTRTQQDSLIDVLGSKFRIDANKNFTRFDAQFLSKDTEQAMDLYSNILLKPNFPKTEIRLKIEEVL